MSKLPKLKIKPIFSTGAEADICDLEQAKNRFDYAYETIVLVEGQVVNSYEELVQIATQYQNKEFLEVTLLPFIAGG